LPQYSIGFGFKHEAANLFRARGRSGSPSPNKSFRRALSVMPERKSVGTMKTQPAGRNSTTATPGLPMMPTLKAPIDIPHQKRQPSRKDAVRAAKAKITRRKSLRKQRDGLKAG
jgi:hypothetical protein